MSDSSLTRAVVVVLLAVLVYAPLARESPTAISVENGNGSGGHVDDHLSVSSSLIGGTGPGGEATDALTLLADFANLDVTPTAVLEYAARLIEDVASRCLSADLPECVETDSQARTLIDALPDVTSGREGVRETTVADATEALQRELAAATAGHGPQAPGEGETARASGGPSVRSPFAEALAVAIVKDALAGLEYRVRFLVATLADACDSYTGGAFDPALEAIRRAVEADGYVLDRFYFPDWTPAMSANQAGSQCTGTRHEQHPGIVMFRRAATGARPDRPARPPSLLLLFTVPETPTAGIHPAAFVRAVRFITLWDGAPAARTASPGGLRTIRIVGPTFSGTSASLARTIERLPEKLAPSYAFEIISGSATDSGNQDVLTLDGTDSHGPVTFSATTLSDDLMLRRLDDFFGELGIDSDNTALLFESNTAYGDSIRETRGTGTPGEPGGPLRLTFPLHVSRIRSLAPTQPGIGGLSPDTARSLTLEDARTPIDLLPPLRPDTTTPSAEIMLGHLLHTVQQERARAVGIFATDTRDKLFLARELRRRAPDALIYTSENDVLLAHPSATPFTRGMVVLSSYALYGPNQGWTANTRERWEYPSMFAAGTYNAAILHLRRLEHSELPLSEFGVPFRDCKAANCAPPVWISVVGRRRSWPVRVYDTNQLVMQQSREEQPESARAPYTPPEPAYVSPPSRGSFRTPYTTAALFVGLTLFAQLHVIAYWRLAYRRTKRFRGVPVLQRIGRRPGRRRARPGGQPDGPWQHAQFDRSLSLLACFVALSLLYGASAGLFWTWFSFSTIGSTVAWRLLPLSAVLATLIGLLVTTAAIVWRSRPDLADHLLSRRSTERGRMWGRALYCLVCTSVVGLAVIFSVKYVWSLWTFGWPREMHDMTDVLLTSVLFFERATTLSNGVTPMVPVILLTAAAYFWGAQRLSQFGPGQDMRMTDRLTVWSDGPNANLTAASNGSSLHARLVAVVAVVLVVCGSTLGRRWPVTIEGSELNDAVFWTVTLIQVLIAVATIRILHDHRLIHAYLDRLTGHPAIVACARLPEDVISARRLLVAPRLPEAGELVSRWQQLADRLAAARETAPAPSDRGGETPSGSVDSSRDARLERAGATIQTTFVTESSSPRTYWRDSRTLRHARARTDDLVRLVEEGRGAASSLGDRLRAMRAAEECLAIEVVLGLREAFSHLATRAFYIMAAAILLLASHTLYPMQPRQTLLAITWANVAVAVAVGLAGLVAIDRHRTLNAITRRPDGTINWNWVLARRVILFAVVPLLSVVAAQFPELGTTVLNWIEPVQALF